MVTNAEWQQELATRRQQVWEVGQQHDCDLILVYGGSGHAEPFRYLTNFVPVLGDSWGILTGPAQMTSVMNFQWQILEARALSGLNDWYARFDPLPILTEQLADAAPQRIGVVALHRLPVLAYNAIQAALPNVAWVDITADVARLRRAKSPLEITLLREACRITDVALDTIRDELQPGMTEHEVAARLAYLMQSQGADLAFEPSVIADNDHPIMIRRPTSRKLQAGDSVMIDIGAAYQGYQADASRTFVIPPVNDKQREVWDVIRRAYDASLSQCGPGIPCLETHRAALAVIEGAGYELVHRVGHGIGLGTSFEWPSLDSETDVQIPGMTFCLEPGIYVPGSGNMKYEDDVLITDTGYEVLTKADATLVLAR